MNMARGDVAVQIKRAAESSGALEIELAGDLGNVLGRWRP